MTEVMHESVRAVRLSGILGGAAFLLLWLGVLLVAEGGRAAIPVALGISRAPRLAVLLTVAVTAIVIIA